MKKYQTRENMFMYGIGHGGIEVWIITAPAILLYLTIAILVQTQGMEATLVTLGVTEAQKSLFQPSLDLALNFGTMAALLTIFERLVCMGIHIAFTIIVFYGVKFKQKRYLLYAILGHALFDVAAALYQRAVIPMYVCEIWLAFWLLIFGFWAKKLYNECKEQISEPM